MTDPSTYQFRFVQPGDAAEITEIYRPYVEDSIVSWEFQAPEEGDFLHKINNWNPNYPWIVCECNGQVAGYAYAAEHRDRIGYQWCVEGSIYVHPNHRKKSLGKSLYTALFDLLKLQGYHVVLAIISVPNIPSVALHESLGFTKTASFENIGFKYDQWQSSEWYIKRLFNKEMKAADIIPVMSVEPSKVEQIFQESLKNITP